MESIFQHLGIEASPERVNAVSDNIDSSLVRSKSLKWESDAIVQGQLADNIYDALRRKDFGMMQVLKSEIQRIIEEEKLESVSYIDEEYQCYVSPSFIRQASQGENGLNGCKKSMLDLVEQSRRNGMLPEACNHQSRLIETYTIKLPFDIEDSEKKYVQCGRDHKKKTLEECFHCWQVGGMGFNGLGEFISLPAERIR